VDPLEAIELELDEEDAPVYKASTVQGSENLQEGSWLAAEAA
jgi:hypothetical protein